MNKIYKCIWNVSLGAWVAVSELACSKKKTKSSTTKVNSKARLIIFSKNILLAGAAFSTLTISSFTFSADVPIVTGSGNPTNWLLRENKYWHSEGGRAEIDTPNYYFTGFAIGKNAKSSESGIAIGDNSKAYSSDQSRFGGNALAIGAGATTDSGIAMGSLSLSKFDGVAIGRLSVASVGGTTIGAASNAIGKGSVAVGKNATAEKDGAIAIGGSQNDGFSYKENTFASGKNAIAMGNNTKANHENAIAIGANSVANSEKSLALGSDASVLQNADNAVAIGAGSVANTANTVSFGNDSLQRTLTNVNKGKISADSVDAINGSQLHATNTSIAEALGGGSTVDADGKVTAPTYIVDGKDVKNVGDAITNIDGRVTDNSKNITELGKTLNEGVFSVSANGTGASKVAKDAVIDYSNTDKNINIAQDGTKFQFNLADQLVVKDGIKVGETGPSLSKDGIDAAGTVVTNIKDGSNATDAVSKGQLDKSLVDAGLVDENGNKTSVVTYDADNNVALKGKDGKGSVITNLEAGKVTADSKDAINGSQLHATNTSIAEALGGGSTVDADGKVTAPTYTVDGKTVTNLGDAITNVDGRVTENTTNISNITETLDKGAFSVSANGKGASKVEKDAVIDYSNTDGNIKIAQDGTKFQFNLADQLVVKDGIKIGEKGPSLSKDGLDAAGTVVTNIKDGTGATDAVSKGQLDKSLVDAGLVDENGNKVNAVTYDADNNVALKGKDGKGSVISNLEAGQVTADSKDAINGSQLHATNTSIAEALGGGSKVDKDGKVTAPTYTVDGKTVTNLGDAITNVDGRVTENTTNISNITETLDKGAFSVSANGTGASKVAKGAVIDYSNTDKNINIAKDGTKFQFNLADRVVVNEGIKIGEKGPSLSKDGIDAAGTVVTNIKDGTGATDAVSKGQLDKSLVDAGLVDENGNKVNAVTYDADNNVALKGKDGKGSVISNLEAGQVTADSKDAINGSQLHATNTSIAEALGGGSKVDKDGKVTAPTYTVDGKTVTNLGDAITNVDGRVTENTTNISNITETLDKGAFSVSANDTGASKVAKDAVIDYSNTDKNINIAQDGTKFQFNLADRVVVNEGIKIGEKGPSLSKDGLDAAGTVVTNIKDGTGATDAVSKGQLDKSLVDAGLVDENGNKVNAVTYDADNNVALKGKDGKGSVISNLEAGQVTADSKDAINGSQLHATNTSIAEALGGGSKVDKDGKVTAPTYTVDGKTVTNLGDAITNVDGRVTENTTNISNITETLDKGAFSVSANDTGASKVAKDAVIDYSNTDKNINIAQDGTKFQFNLADRVVVNEGIKIGEKGPSLSKDGLDAAGTVVTNIKDGTGATDAVSKGQLDKSLVDAGLVDENGNKVNAVTYDADNNVALKGKDGKGSVISNLEAGQVTADSKDAINGSQLHATNTSIAEALGGGSKVDKDGKVTAPTYTVDGKTVTNLGDAITNVDGRVTENTTNISNITETLDKGAFSVSANGTGASKVAKGAVIDYSNTDKNINIAQDGTKFQFNLADRVVVNEGIKIGEKGPSLSKDGLDAAGTVVTNIKDGTGATDAVSKGQLDKSLVDAGLVDENGNKVNAVTYDADNNVALKGKDGKGSVISNLEAGQVTADSKDAINGSQLHATNTSIAEALGGGSKVDKDGKVTAPTYTVDGKTVTNLGDAITNVDGRVTENTTNISNITETLDKGAFSVSANGTGASKVAKGAVIDYSNTDKNINIAQDGTKFQFNLADRVVVNEGIKIGEKGPSLSKDGLDAAGTVVTNIKDGTGATDAVSKGQLDKSLVDAGLVDENGNKVNAVTYDADNNVALKGKDGKGSVISNLEAGQVTADSKDAINGSQLHATNTSIAEALGGGSKVDKDGKVTAPTYTVDGKTVTNLGDAITNVDGRVTENTTNISNITETLDKGAFSVSANGTGASKVAKGAVIDYSNTDKNINIAQDGTKFQFNLADRVVVNEGIKIGEKGPSLSKDGLDAAGTVVTNIKDGTGATDAVSKGQLDKSLVDAGLVDENGNKVNAVTYDADNNVALKGKDGKGSVISNLEAGQVTADSKDAINGSQLHATNTSIAEALGGGSKVDKDGKVTAPTYTVDGKTVTNLGDAITNVDGRVTENTTNISNITETLEKGAFSVSANGKGASKVEKDAVIDYSNTDKNINIAKDGTKFQFNLADRVVVNEGIKIGEKGPSLSKDGLDAAGTVVTNIKDGTGATDAVSKGQLDKSLVDAGLVDENGNKVNAVTYDADNNVALKGKDGKGSVISNLEAGQVTADSKDAINGSQLHATNTSIAEALGGGSKVDKDGKVTAPTYTVDGKTVTNLGDAITNVDGRVTENTTNISNITETLDKGAFSVSANGTGASKVAKGAVIDYSNTDKNINIAQDGTKFQFNLADRVVVNEGIKIGEKGPSLSKDGLDAAGTVVTNIKDGTGATDAVSKGQLDKSLVDAGLVDENGNKVNAVTYDADNNVALKGKDGKGSVISNLEAGQVTADSKDAINGSQLHATNTSIAEALGGGSKVDKDGKVTAPTYTVDGKTVTNLGDAITNVDGRVTENTTNISNITETLDKGAFSVSANGTGASKVAKGAVIDYSNTDKNINIAQDGTKFQFNLADRVVVNEGIKIGEKGPSLSKDGLDAAGTVVTNIKDGTGATDAVSKGQLDKSLVDAGLVDENGNKVNAVTYDADNNVALKGKDGKGSVISNLEAGQVTADSKDAINGSQLHATNTSIAEALGGGSKVDKDGKVTAPTYTVDGKTVTNLGDAITNVDGRVTENTTNISNITETLDKGAFSVSANGTGASKVAKGAVIDYSNTDKNINIAQDGTKFQFNLADRVVVNEGIKIGEKGPSLSKDGLDAAGTVVTNIKDGTGATDAVSKGQLDKSLVDAGLVDENGNKVNAVTYDADNNVALKGKDGKGSVISNLEAGQVTADSKDAINGSQLHATNTSIAEALGGGSKVDKDGKVTAPTYTVDGKTVTNLGDAITNVDGRVTENTTNISNITDTLDKGAFSVSANGTGASKVEKDAVIDYSSTDGNIKIAQDGTKFQFNLADQLVVKDGIKVGEKGPSLSKDGIDAAGTVVTNIKDGTNATDAVSKGQLDKSLLDAGLVDENGNKVSVVTYDADNNVALKGKDGKGSVITNLETGKVTADSKDAINGSQLHATNTSIAEALGGGSTVDADGKVTAPTYTVDGKTVTNLGDAITNVDGRVTENTTNISNITDTLDKGAFSVSANGAGATKVAKDAVIDYSNTDGNIKIAQDGTKFQFNLADRVVVNEGIKIGEKGPSLSKDGIDAAGTVVTNIKDGTNATDAVSKGQLDKSLVDAGLVDENGNKVNAVTYDADNNVALKGKDGKGSVITNLETGKVTADSKDAINGSQLHATNTSIAEALGGGSKVDKDGKVTAPTYTVDGKTVTNLGDAITNVDGRVTENTTNISNITETLDKGAFSVSANDTGASKVAKDAVIDYSNTDKNINIAQDGTKFQFNLADRVVVNEGIKIGEKGPSLSKDGFDAAGTVVTNIKDGTGATDAVSKGQLDKSLVDAGLVDENGNKVNAVTYDTDNNVALKGKDGKGSVITNLEAGKVTADSKDAINGSQLHATNTSIAEALGGGSTVDADGKVTAPTYIVDGKEVKNIGDAITNVDGRVTENTTNISNITETLDNGAFSVSANGAGATKVAKDAVIDYSNTDGNIKIAQDGTKFQFNFADRVVVNEGIKIGEKGPSLSKDGIDAAGTVVTNIKDGTNATDAVSKGQLDKSLVDAGLVDENGNKVSVVTYDADNNVALKGKDGKGSVISNLEAGKVTADSKYAINGSQLHVISTSISNSIGGNTKVGSDGSIITSNIGGTGKNNIHDAIASIRKDSENASQGWSIATDHGDKSNVKPGDTVNFKGDENVTVSNTGSTVTVGLNKDLNVDSVTTGDTKIDDNGLTIVGGPSVTKDGINAGGKAITGVGSGLVDEKGNKVSLDKAAGGNVVNIDDLRNTVGTATAAAKTEVSAGKNMKVTSTVGENGQTVYNVATADDVDFKSVNANKVSVGSVQITDQGIHAGDHKVTAVADGTVSKDSKDAVNGGQLFAQGEGVKNIIGGQTTYDPKTGSYSNKDIGGTGKDNVHDAIGSLNGAVSNIDDKVTMLGERMEQVFYDTNKRINNVEKKANAGIAAAMAMESAPFVAGKFTYSAGAAYHGGENAVGVTLRKTSDSGRWSITGGVAAASQGDPSVRVGISGVID